MPKATVTVYTVDEARRREAEVVRQLRETHHLTERRARELADAYVLDDDAWALLDELDTLRFLVGDAMESGAIDSVA